jgi:hypothetical protein
LCLPYVSLKIRNPCRVFVLSICANKQTTASRLAGGFSSSSHARFESRVKNTTTKEGGKTKIKKKRDKQIPTLIQKEI